MLALCAPPCLRRGAALVNSKIRGVKLFRVLFYLPSVSWIPTPGNSAAGEASSALVFTTLLTAVSGITSWMVLLWRFAIYYVYILSGIGISIFEIIRSAVRNKRAAKKEQKESK